MAQVIMTAVLAFVATNLDDIVILMLLFSAAGAGKAYKIIFGQYLGIGALTVISLLGAMGLGLLPGWCLRLLGLVPLALGLRAWCCRNADRDTDEEPETVAAPAVFGTAMLTVANGADNLGVYLPLFAGYRAAHNLLVVLVFAGMTGVWCFLGKHLADLPVVQRVLTRYRGVLIPWVLMLLGLYILLF